MKPTLTGAALALLTWAAVASPASTAAAATKDHPKARNVVLILFDDLSPWALEHQAPTPNLDALAASGATFTNAYALSSTCRPDRAGTHTGLYQQRFGIYRNPPDALRTAATDPNPLPASAVTIAEDMTKAKRFTALYGKWHLGFSPPLAPVAQGFKDGEWYLGGGHQYYGGPLLTPTRQITYKGNLTEYLGDQAAAFIRRNADRPFYLELSSPTPHDPPQSDDSQMRDCHQATREERVFCGMLVGGDRSVGAVMQALRDTGHLNDTLVIFTADNGCAAGACSDGGLRGTKGNVWEGGTRVPMTMAWPGVIPRGVKVGTVVSALDIMPTALDAVGQRPTKSLDGVSLLPGLRQGSPTLAGAMQDRPLFWANKPGRWSMRLGQWKLYFEAKRWQLYDVVKDPDETNDVAKENPKVVAAMAPRVEAWGKTLPPAK